MTPTHQPIETPEEAVDHLIGLVQSICNHPVEVRLTETETCTIIEISTDKNSNDAGRLVGSKGCVIKSLKELARVLSARYDRRISLELLD